ncbi:hypothetical protein AK812_SmicGene48847, partial [Symbiodinium microadriaticum]
ARKCFTVCAATWGDGTAGPVAISVPPNAVPGKLLWEWNTKYIGIAHWLVNEETHFFNAETVCVLFEQLYTPALKLQRAKYSLTREVKAMLQTDGFTGGHAAG